MKRIVMTAAFAASIFFAGTITAEAQIPPQKKETQTEQTQDKKNEFKQIKLSKLPNKVVKSVKSKMKGAKLVRAYVNESKQYKLIVKVDDQLKKVFMNKKGEIIRPKQK